MLASLPGGLGVGIIVGGSLRSIVINEALVASRTAAGFGMAYAALTAVVAGMMVLTLRLRRG